MYFTAWNGGGGLPALDEGLPPTFTPAYVILRFVYQKQIFVVAWESVRVDFGQIGYECLVQRTDTVLLLRHDRCAETYLSDRALGTFQHFARPSISRISLLHDPPRSRPGGRLAGHASLPTTVVY